MLELGIESTRGDLVESVHRVSVAVVDADDRLVASAGEPDLVTFWRSAAKPFQAIPVVADGAADAVGFSDEMLALACASHSSEPGHRALALGMLAQAGHHEHELACGPHVPLSPAVAATVVREGIAMTPSWSNCSGKHAAMLAQARHAGWPSAGYVDAAHPLQQRLLDEVSRWTGVARHAIGLGIDGCTTVCFALPLRAMALAYARLAVSEEPAARRVREAFMAHPWLVAGTGRLCTDLMASRPRLAFAKLGAEGVYCAGLPGLGLGLALKVEDGDMRAAPIALLAVLRDLVPHVAGLAELLATPAVARHAALPLENTRGAVTGYLRARGALRFAPARAGMVRA
ncbi:MAG: asparaginase [Gemmatimonadales bacterium]|jgi:L-asparaginase II|nr:asparaginase [Gemmatimonadales bacterium]